MKIKNRMWKEDTKKAPDERGYHGRIFEMQSKIESKKYY